MTQRKGRRIPIQLQQAVQEEIERLLNERLIIQPVVRTVKREKSVKIALDARASNNELVEDKYQMLKLEYLVDMVAEQLDIQNEGQACNTSLDMRYAYGQVPLDKETIKYCNFQIIGGRATGTYRFITVFAD